MNPQNQPTPPVPQTAEELRQQLQRTFAEINQMNARFQQLSTELQTTREELNQTRAEAAARQLGGGGRAQAKPNKPTPFKGDPKANVESWLSQMDLYTQGEDADRAFAVAVSYLEGDAHTWFQTYKTTNEVRTWEELKEALLKRFNPLDKTLAARDKLARWRQVKDVSAFNRDFLQILLDIPDISEAEKLDRYTRGLKSHLWEPLCTKTYETLEQCMTDALKVEAAKRGNNQRINTSFRGKPAAIGPSGSNGGTSGSVPMDLSATDVIKKLTPEERERCMKEGLCLRCRAKGHMAKDCPKGKGRTSNQ